MNKVTLALYGVNVVCNLSSNTKKVSHNVTFLNLIVVFLLSYLQQPIIIYSCAFLIANRCMFASNFPVDKIKGTFSELVTGLETILKPYSLEDKKKFFSENAKRFYRL